MAYGSSNPGCFRQLIDIVHVRILDLNAPDDEFLGLLPCLVVDVQRINLSNLSRKVTPDLI